jgi:hypothetical protein
MKKIKNHISSMLMHMVHLLALPTTKALKDIVVFRFIIEYISLKDFGPLGT